MNELNKVFNEYMNEFKKLSINGKRQEILNSLKEFIAVVDYVAEKYNLELDYLQCTEINDVSEDCDCSENDYLEALIVYIEVAKNLVGEYLEKRSL